MVRRRCKSELHSFCQPAAWSPPGKYSGEECETSKGTTQPQTPGTFSVCRTSDVSLQYFQHLSCAKDKRDLWPTNGQLFIINISHMFWLSKSTHVNFGCKVLTQWYYSYKTWKSKTSTWYLVTSAYSTVKIYYRRITFLPIYFLRAAAVTFPIDSVQLRKLRGKWIRVCLTLCIMTPGYQIPDSETKIIVMVQNKCLGLYLSDANNTNSLCQVNVEIGKKKPQSSS